MSTLIIVGPRFVTSKKTDQRHCIPRETVPDRFRNNPQHQKQLPITSVDWW